MRNRFNIFSNEELDNSVTEGEESSNSPKEEEAQELITTLEESNDVMEDVNDNIEDNDELLEERPDEVTEENVQVAQETLYLSLAKLGYDQVGLSKFRVNFESCYTPQEKLLEINNKLKLMQNIYNKTMLKLARENIALSLEYNAMDWPQFFLRYLNTGWRMFTNNSMTRINNPALLVSVLTGKWTTIGKLWNMLDPYNLTIFGINALIFKQAAIYNNIDSNAYQDVIVNYRSLTPKNLEIYKQEFENFKSIIKTLKSRACTPCVERRMSTTEITGIKLFKPERAYREIKRAVDGLTKLDPKLGKLASEIGSFVGKEIIDFIIQNTIRDV